MVIKLKVTNRTGYSTREMKKLRNWVGGCGWYHSGRWKILMPKTWNGTPERLAEDFAQTCVHEIYHCLGVKHGRMRTDVRYCTVKVPFAEGVALARKTAKKKVTTQDRVDAREKKAQGHVERLEREIAQAEAAIKRKRKLQTKWRAKVRYYERRRENPPPPRPKPKSPTRFETLKAAVAEVGWDLRKYRWWDGYEGGAYRAVEIEGTGPRGFKRMAELKNLNDVGEWLERRREEAAEPVAATG